MMATEHNNQSIDDIYMLSLGTGMTAPETVDFNDTS